jgi:hypothetical protein
MAPVLVPFTSTFTPGSGPVAEETFPVMVCALTIPQQAINASKVRQQCCKVRIINF